MVSKDFCVEMHRKMWNWIVDRIIQTNSFPGLYNLKKAFWNENRENEVLKTIQDPDLYKYCFCCLYACMKNNTDVYQNVIEGCRACKDCPMCWNSKGIRHQCCDEAAEYSYFNKLKNADEDDTDLKEISAQCRKVAELPVNQRS